MFFAVLIYFLRVIFWFTFALCYFGSSYMSFKHFSQPIRKLYLYLGNLWQKRSKKIFWTYLQFVLCYLGLYIWVLSIFALNQSENSICVQATYEKRTLKNILTILAISFMLLRASCMSYKHFCARPIRKEDLMHTFVAFG